MCGRYILRAPAPTLAQMFLDERSAAISADDAARLEGRFNIAPTQDVPIVRQRETGGPRELELVRWGLVPLWAKDVSIGARMINARVETAHEKPAFKDALRKRRCLVLADGFIEWERVGKRKLPWLFELEGARPFAFAGLWERKKLDDGWLISTTILTTEANGVVAPLHDRMPVMLPDALYDEWLDPNATTPDMVRVAQPWPDDRLHKRRVSTRVNNVRHDDAACIAAPDDDT